MVARITPILQPIIASSEPIVLRMPPDKSILHRLLILGSLTTSHFKVPITSRNSISDDVIATMLALESLGVPVDIGEDSIELQGVGRHGLRAPTHAINCANSGTTARLMMGLLAGQEFNSVLTGDASLSQRPMKRLADVLAEMNAIIATMPMGTLPVEIAGQHLRAVSIMLPVASAQMKTAILLAGLFAKGMTTVREPTQSRDHTERMMEAFGFGIEHETAIRIRGNQVQELEEEIVYEVPGDFSSAAFMIAAAVLLRKRLVIPGICLNPSRTRFLDILSIMGVELESENVTEAWLEPRGDLIIYGDRILEPLKPFQVEGEEVPLLIDELPILLTLALFADGESTVSGARELRVKESDRLHGLASQFLAFGVELEETEDGISVHGISDRRLWSTPIVHEGDHRLLMSFTIASLFANSSMTIEKIDAAEVSYPEFFHHLWQLCGRMNVEVSE
ncbi:MAG TPA: 3-phosphoshikimate 1-carboxyvinyltransferase [Candidatus Kapabacteria bacterium]|jgi:3-phosphoshikimate 1-carboxyvinyltransferase